MKKLLVASLGAALLMGASAHAATIYATGITSSQGAVADGTVTPGSRTDGDNALGATDGAFYSLGVGGWATLTFGDPTGQPFQTEGSIVEVTFGNPANHPESVDIWVGNSDDGSGDYAAQGWTYITNVANVDAQTGFTFAIAGQFTYMGLKDTSPSGPNRDGFDVDSVSVSAVPLPAGGALLLAAIGGLGLARRRK